MNFMNSYKKKLLVFFTVCFMTLSSTIITVFFIIPDEITLFEGEDSTYNFKSPILFTATMDKEGIIYLKNKNIFKNNTNITTDMIFRPQKSGTVNLNFKIFGLIPLKTLHVDVISNREVVACGNTIGVNLSLDGVLVIGVSDVQNAEGKKVFPAKDCGIKAGDLILAVNNIKIDNIDKLISEIEHSHGEKVNLFYKRGSARRSAKIKPIKSQDDFKFHIGLWVRDSTAGIGTLTFYDTKNMCFGALGHGITDIDTGKIIPVRHGSIMQSNILTVKKGLQGSPGELKGIFSEDKNVLGHIIKNCCLGIYGKINSDAIAKLNGTKYKVALKRQVKEGSASILANVDGQTVDEYKIEIQKIARQNSYGMKGMIIKVIDDRLISKTGGIVQGMSGSPILQDGKIIGAVTHVLVNDPTRGYGVFLEWMLKNMDNLT